MAFIRKMTSIKKTQPFIENVLIGTLFVLLGFYILDGFNTHFYGLVGLTSIFWGGFKILIGLIIYSIYFWAILFKPESFIHIKQKRSFERVLQRTRKDIEFDQLDKAKDRFHGLISKYPNHLKAKFELAEVYRLEKNFAQAGRYLFLKPNLNKQEQNYVEAFKDSLGNNSFQILKDISKASKIDLEFVQSSEPIISQLIDNIKIKSEKKSWIVHRYEHLLVELNTPKLKIIVRNQKDIIIHLLVFFSLLCLTEFLK